MANKCDSMEDLTVSLCPFGVAVELGGREQRNVLNIETKYKSWTFINYTFDLVCCHLPLIFNV